MQYGLSKCTLDQIKDILSHYPEVEQALLYGSRAKGTFKKGSDIDVTLIGPFLDLKVLSQIMNEFDDSLLPYTIDLSIFHQISNLDLQEHIQRVGVVIYKKS